MVRDALLRPVFVAGWQAMMEMEMDVRRLGGSEARLGSLHDQHHGTANHGRHHYCTVAHTLKTSHNYIYGRNPACNNSTEIANSHKTCLHVLCESALGGSVVAASRLAASLRKFLEGDTPMQAQHRLSRMLHRL